jgi:hypothetical protein
MKRLCMGAVMLLLLAFFGSSVATAETTIGVGYQAMFVQEFLQGASARGWFDNKWGLEGNIMYTSMGVNVDGVGEIANADMWFLAGKLMYAPVIRENSQFYVGVGGGWGKLEAGITDLESGDLDVWTVGPLFGAEYRFQGLPDMGFNWEVGYQFANLSAEGIDLDLNGITVSLGVHYYLR